MTRFLRLVLLASLAALVVGVPSAVAGNFDEEKMGCVGENPATCPSGTVGQPYSMTIYLSPPDGGRGEDFGCATFRSSGAFPPGLSISDEGYITGTPTQAGTYDFYLEVFYNKNPGCAKPTSDDRFIITINPGVPKLTIGPEAAPVGTVGTPYSLQMTASVEGAKTWTINSGALPPGLAIDASTGLISGAPAIAGAYTFQVLARMSDGRSDTKVLGIVVRNPLVLTGSQPFTQGSGGQAEGRAQAEVSVRFSAVITATGGDSTYGWTISSGALPPGLAFSGGSIAGRPTTAGVYFFSATVTDGEGRTASYGARIVVAPRLAIATAKLRPGRVGKTYRARLVATGGVTPTLWFVPRGPLPRGVKLDRRLGVLSGIPKKAGRYKFRLQVRDSLGVRSTKSYLIVVKAAPKPKR